MDKLETDISYTKIHAEELDNIFNNDCNVTQSLLCQNATSQIKNIFHFLRKKSAEIICHKKKSNTTNIIYITLDCPEYISNSVKTDLSVEYIMQMRKQYPENDIRILIPLINLPQNIVPGKNLSLMFDDKILKAERTSISFQYFHQNKFKEAVLYKFLPDNLHVQVYGLFSSCYSYCNNPIEMSKLQNISAFLKASRICIKKLTSSAKENFKPDVVHCDTIPFFLGTEFDYKFSYKTKVIQIIKDFAQINITKTEPFWAAINMAEPIMIKKICSDSIIKRHLARLFNLHNTKRFYNMNDCLEFIYDNYYRFRKYVDKGEDLDENIVFNSLNKRILKLFPQITYQNNTYNTMLSTLCHADSWITLSETYYNAIFNIPTLTSEMYASIIKTKDKSSYISIGLDTNKYPLDDKHFVFHPFDKNNFRELRQSNKFTLLKEFSADKIQNNITDTSLFKNNDFYIAGYLDSFYEAPLLFANLSPDVFANGIDVMFNSILKLFESYKNIQCMINISGGMNIHYIKAWVDFLTQQSYTKGRFVFIDGEIDLPKFYSSADISIFPHRLNTNTQEHLLSMHYGCVPVVSRVGLFNDQVKDIFEDITEGCGFKTRENILLNPENTDILTTPLLKAVNVYQNNHSSWNLLIKNCLNKDVNWNFETLEKYNQIYYNI